MAVHRYTANPATILRRNRIVRTLVTENVLNVWPERIGGVVDLVGIGVIRPPARLMRIINPRCGVTSAERGVEGENIIVVLVVHDPRQHDLLLIIEVGRAV